MSNKKTIKDRVKKECACCEKGINVILYSDRSYRGGHYFFDVPFYKNENNYKVIGYTDRNFKEISLTEGIKREKNGEHLRRIIEHLEKPYKHEEYWECPKCYWQY